MVGNALDRLRDEHQFDRARDRLWLLDHVARQLAVELPIEVVDLGVSPAHGQGPGFIHLQETIERLAKHLQGHGRHAGQIDVGLQRRLRAEADRALGDAGRFVPHTLQIVARLHADDHQAQVAGDRRPQIHVANRLVIDLDFEPVQPVIVGDHVLGQGDVGFHQRLHRRANLCNGRLSHEDQLRTEGLEFGVEKTFHRGKMLWCLPGLNQTARRHRLRFGDWRDS